MKAIQLAFRSLTRNPGFAAVVITLALGIGANTAIFSFFQAILLRPLPYAEPERIVVFKKSAHDFSEPMGVETGLLVADFRELRGQTQSLTEIATYTLDAATLSGRGAPDLATGAVVTPNFFSLLGAKAALGRTFAFGDAGNSAAGRLALVSHRYWQERLGGDPAIAGQTLTLNRVPFTIVGVLPPDFDFPCEAQFWVTPAADVPESTIGVPSVDFGGRGNYVRTIIGRLRNGVSLREAEQELAAQVARLPNPNRATRSVHLVTMRDQSVGTILPALALLLGCVALVLLIACFNVANLMLSRAVSRQREFGIRLALGSGRWRIARQLLGESTVLALLGGAAGVVLCFWGLDLLVHLAPEGIPRLAAVRIDAGVLAFALGATLATGIGCGLAPVFGATGANLLAAMRSGGDRGGSAPAAAQRLRATLVAGEVAVSLVLLVAAGLLFRSLEKLRATSWGFEPRHVVSARVVFMDERYNTPEALYFPYLQAPFNSFYLHVRTPLDVALVGTTIKQIVQSIDASVPVSNLASMEQVVAGPVQARQFPLGLLAAFAALALLLAGLGIYAVTAYGVAQRTREIGVRMALGATPRSVVALVLRQSTRPIAVGVAVGLIGAVWTALAMRGLLFEIGPLDLPTFLVIVLVLLTLAAIASWLPARRATQIDPIIALRAE